MSLVYLDASVLAAWAIDSDDEHVRATGIITDIRNGTIDAITSSVAVMEVIDAVRKRLAEDYPYKGDPRRTDLTVLEAEISREVEDFLLNMLALSRSKNLIWEDPENPFNQILQEAIDLHRDDFGHFWHTHKKVHRVPRQCYLYDGLSQWDIQHAVLAKLLNATELYTFDNDFELLRSMPAFNGTLTISIL